MSSSVTNLSTLLNQNYEKGNLLYKASFDLYMLNALTQRNNPFLHWT